MADFPAADLPASDSCWSSSGPSHAGVRGLLFGNTMAWGAHDSSGMATAMLKGLLDELFPGPMVRAQLINRLSAGHMALQETDLGFAFWALGDAAELDVICAAVHAVRYRNPAAVCAVLIDPTRAECLLQLVEAGAQIVVSRLPSLERAVRHAAKCFPLVTRGTHPLTCELNRLLPWS